MTRAKTSICKVITFVELKLLWNQFIGNKVVIKHVASDIYSSLGCTLGLRLLSAIISSARVVNITYSEGWNS